MYLQLLEIFFFTDPATTEIYTLSLLDALPICLSLLAFTPTAATVTLVKFDPRCHVNQITRKWHVGPPPNFLSGIWAPCSVYTVNFICSPSYLRKLHCLG